MKGTEESEAAHRIARACQAQKLIPEGRDIIILVLGPGDDGKGALGLTSTITGIEPLAYALKCVSDYVEETKGDARVELVGKVGDA